MQSPQGVEDKRNLQHVKPLASTRDNTDWPDQPSSPDHVDANPQGQSEPMGSVPTATPAPHSGRASWSPRALEDYVLY